jgi:hypothetical protein
MEVLRGVLVRRVVAAADVAAAEAKSEMHPRAAGLETFLAAVRRARLHIADLVEVCALLGHVLSDVARGMHARGAPFAPGAKTSI